MAGRQEEARCKSSPVAVCVHAVAVAVAACLQAVVFSQWTSMLDIIKRVLRGRMQTGQAARWQERQDANRTRSPVAGRQDSKKHNGLLVS